MKRYCHSCGKKNINGRYRICQRCAKKKIDDNGLTKAKGSVVYGLYDYDGRLSYIGVTNSMTDRVTQHFDKKVFNKMKIIRRFETRTEADAFEIFSIWHLNPPLNIKRVPPIDGGTFGVYELDAFGEISSKPNQRGRSCAGCSTVLSRYNTADYCNVCKPKPRFKKRRRK